ncbi:hypothetical protein Naga_100628g7 [Nannochloropsis gaditana]|uniref:Signal recognition particle subunit SRP68 n=1 Tax=Nannochloropsis gaditana TaxID=72520 RepID=W7TCR6_9STRA|nr:hypothetical protein Naga_100628g7 [Nannochloropsis gaditana]
MAADNHIHEDESNDAVTPFGAPSSSVPSSLLDLPLHHMLRTLQLQHGLRHGDYQRYRHYLNRRLARLRKGVNATHRGGKAFESKNVHSLAYLEGDSSALKKEHLLLVLLNAERAFAMHLQQDAAGNQHMPSYVRSHLLRRLRRAGVWAARLLGVDGGRGRCGAGRVGPRFSEATHRILYSQPVGRAGFVGGARLVSKQGRRGSPVGTLLSVQFGGGLFRRLCQLIWRDLKILILEDQNMKFN